MPHCRTLLSVSSAMDGEHAASDSGSKTSIETSATRTPTMVSPAARPVLAT
jgi:hypothetical protein